MSESDISTWLRHCHLYNVCTFQSLDGTKLMIGGCGPQMLLGCGSLLNQVEASCDFMMQGMQK